MDGRREKEQKGRGRAKRAQKDIVAYEEMGGREERLWREGSYEGVHRFTEIEKACVRREKKVSQMSERARMLESPARCSVQGKSSSSNDSRPTKQHIGTPTHPLPAFPIPPSLFPLYAH
jgi:hypothetical protein